MDTTKLRLVMTMKCDWALLFDSADRSGNNLVLRSSFGEKTGASICIDKKIYSWYQLNSNPLITWADKEDYENINR